MATAPTLNAASTTFSASNLPPGAILDSTGIFRWTPTGGESGAYPAVHFEATDGVQSVSEDVTITVTEANLSIAGSVTHSGGGSAANMALRLTGPSGPRSLSSDATGHFRFEGLVPGKYRIRLDRPSKRDYVATVSPQVTLAATDRNDANLVIAPK
jgi:hypothetical protein